MDKVCNFGKLRFDLWLFYLKNAKNTEGPLFSQKIAHKLSINYPT
jgi:hypothetical protein